MDRFVLGHGGRDGASDLRTLLVGIHALLVGQGREVVALPHQQSTAIVRGRVLVDGRMAAGAQEQEVFKGVGFELASRPLLMTWALFAMGDHVRHLRDVLVTAHLGRKQGLQTVRALAVACRLREKPKLGILWNVLSICHASAPNIRGA